jgi:hypothetical protein
MKKQNLKLSLRKINVSKLSNLRGAGPKEAETLSQFDNLCCAQIDPYETQLTTCHTSTSGNDSEFLHCTATIGCASVGC